MHLHTHSFKTENNSQIAVSLILKGFTYERLNKKTIVTVTSKLVNMK
jgi:hypothetical protein